jgi:hypothetical protein
MFRKTEEFGDQKSAVGTKVTGGKIEKFRANRSH